MFEPRSQLLLVLSVAELVLDWFRRVAIRPLDQPSQHRRDPPQLRFAETVGLVIDGREHLEHIVNRHALQHENTRIQTPIQSEENTERIQTRMGLPVAA